MHHRGFTLMELLIAIALILAIAATTLPFLSRRLAPARQQAAESTVSSVVERARIDSMRASGPVRLVAVNRANAPTQLLGLPLGTDLEDFEVSLDESIADPDASGVEPGDVPARAFRSDVRSRLYATLPEGFVIRIQTEQDRERLLIAQASPAPSPFAEDPEFPPEASARAASGDPSPEVITLAILVPDGSAMARDELLLVSPDGSARQLEIEPWTGRVTFSAPRLPQRFTDASDDVASQEDAFSEGVDPFTDPFVEPDLVSGSDPAADPPENLP